MTLERTVSVTTFTTDNLVKTSLDPQTLIDTERGYRTIPNTPKSNRNSRKESGPLRPLNQIASHQTFLTCSSTSAFSKAAWPSEDVDLNLLSSNSAFRNGDVKTPVKGDRSRNYHPSSCNNINSHSSKSRQYKKRTDKRRSTGSISNDDVNVDFNSVPPASCVSLGELASTKRSIDSKSLPHESKTEPPPLDSPPPAKSCAFPYIFKRSRRRRTRQQERASADRDRSYVRRNRGRASAHPRVDSFSSSSFQLPVSPNSDRQEYNTEADHRNQSSEPQSNSKDRVPSSTPARSQKKETLIDDINTPVQEHSIQRQSRSRSERHKQYPNLSSTVPRDRSEDAFCRNPISGKENCPTSENHKHEDHVYVARSTGSHNWDSSRSGGVSGSNQKQTQRSSRSKSQVPDPTVGQTDLEEDERNSDQYCNSSDTKRRKSSIPGPSGFGIYNPEADTKVINDAEDFAYLPTNMKGPLNLSFSGCGFLGMYHLGVATCLVQRAPAFLDRIQKVGGASAGALMCAVLLTCPDKMEDSGVLIQTLSKEIRSKPLGALTPGYSFTRSMRDMLDKILPDNAHEELRGKLHVSLTDATTKKNQLMTDFESKDELIEALVASCHIPVYAGMKFPTIRGKKFMDGGLSDNMPKFKDGRTITVSPFDGKSDIGPKLGQEADKNPHFINLYNQDYQVSIRNFRRGAHAFFPPRRHVLQEYFDKGRYDASRFLIREGFYEINVIQQQQKVVYESSV